MQSLDEALAQAKENPKLKDKSIIGIDGNLYDITAFIKHHPGGDIMKKFISKDATAVFKAFNHKKEWLEKLQIVDTYKLSLDPIDQDFLELGKKFKEMGFFKGDKWFFFIKSALVLSFLGITFYLFSKFDHVFFHILGSFFLFLTWQQSGFLMHDTMHSNIFQNIYYDELVGIFFSIFIFGINGLWWKVDHNTHHALTGVIDLTEKWADPQLIEGIWAQNKKLFPFFTKTIHYYLIKFQAFIFIPMNVIFGRFGIMIDSFLVGEYKRARTFVVYLAWFLHWCMICYLFSFLPTWKRIILIYFIASCLQGILHLQLLVSHYCRPMLYREEFDKTSWFKYNCDISLNITNPTWFDWFHGGLNLHIEHHTFPTIPRHHFRQMTPYIQEICQKHNISYDSCHWFPAIWMTIKHLYKTSLLYVEEKSKKD